MPTGDADLGATVTAGGSTPAPGVGAARLERGSTLGRYTIVEILGEGGMGVVYGAYDPDLDRKVALKLLRVSAGSAASGDARARLLGEARAMAKLNHPNVITVYEVGTVGDRDFVAMEFVDGVSLADWLQDDHDWRDVVRVFRRAGAGLGSAHRAGLVHRDFKPGNVLLGRDGRVLVTDFGLAQDRAGEGTVPEPGGLAAESPAGDVVSPASAGSGPLEGTPAYMAPELHGGRRADERSDQFSFCVALHEALYQQRPFDGDTLEDLRRAMKLGSVPEEPKGSSVPSRLRRAVLRGLSADPDQRYPSIGALVAALRHDPALLRRRLAAIGIVALTGAAIALLLSGGGRNADNVVCDDAERSWEGVWDGEARAKLDRVFTASGPGALDSFRGLSRALDEYKAEWGTIYGDACAATRVRRERSEEDFHLHMGCLLDRRNQVRSLVDVFLRADADTVEHAVQAAQSLPRLEECTDLEALRSGLPPPEDPETRRVVDELRGELAHAKALQETMRYGLALERAQEIADRARATGYRPVVAEALYRLGTLNLLTRKPSRARAILEEAVLVAEESAHDEVRARALVRLVQVAAYFFSDHEDTRTLGRRALAAVQRYGGDGKLKARAESALAQVNIEEGKYDDAIARLEEAVATYELELGPGNLFAAEVQHEIAVVHRLRGDKQTALAVHVKALAATERQLGADHPRVARANEVVGNALRRVGQYDDAREHFARAARYWSTPRGRDLLAASTANDPKPSTRAVRGRVSGVDGRPAPGAEVVIGEILVGDGKYLYAGGGAAEERELGVFHQRADRNGEFAFPDASTQRLYVAAGAGGQGRSLPVEVSAGADDRTVALSLRPIGTIRGRVRVNGPMPPQVQVSAVPADFRASNRVSIDVPVQDSGEFEFERLAVGDYVLLAGLSGHLRAAVLKGTEVAVRPAQTSEVTFDIESDNVELDVVVRGEKGARLDGAQLFLFDSEVHVNGSKALLESLIDSAMTGTVRIGLAHPFFEGDGELPPGLENDQHAKFRANPGKDYSLCVLPILGELKDPGVQRRLWRHVEKLDVHCRPAVVAEGESHQRLIIEVPPMKPLPQPIEQP